MFITKKALLTFEPLLYEKILKHLSVAKVKNLVINIYTIFFTLVYKNYFCFISLSFCFIVQHLIQASKSQPLNKNTQSINKNIYKTNFKQYYVTKIFFRVYKSTVKLLVKLYVVKTFHKRKPVFLK